MAYFILTKGNFESRKMRIALSTKIINYIADYKVIPVLLCNDIYERALYWFKDCMLEDAYCA